MANNPYRKKYGDIYQRMRRDRLRQGEFNIPGRRRRIRLRRYGIPDPGTQSQHDDAMDLDDNGGVQDRYESSSESELDDMELPEPRSLVYYWDKVGKTRYRHFGFNDAVIQPLYIYTVAARANVNNDRAFRFFVYEDTGVIYRSTDIIEPMVKGSNYIGHTTTDGMNWMPFRLQRTVVPMPNPLERAQYLYSLRFFLFSLFDGFGYTYTISSEALIELRDMIITSYQLQEVVAIPELLQDYYDASRLDDIGMETLSAVDRLLMLRIHAMMRAHFGVGGLNPDWNERDYRLTLGDRVKLWLPVAHVTINPFLIYDAAEYADDEITEDMIKDSVMTSYVMPRRILPNMTTRRERMILDGVLGLKITSYTMSDSALGRDNNGVMRYSVQDRFKAWYNADFDRFHAIRDFRMGTRALAYALWVTLENWFWSSAARRRYGWQADIQDGDAPDIRVFISGRMFNPEVGGTLEMLQNTTAEQKFPRQLAIRIFNCLRDVGNRGTRTWYLRENEAGELHELRLDIIHWFRMTCEKLTSREVDGGKSKVWYMDTHRHNTAQWLESHSSKKKKLYLNDVDYDDWDDPAIIARSCLGRLSVWIIHPEWLIRRGEADFIPQILPFNKRPFIEAEAFASSFNTNAYIDWDDNNTDELKLLSYSLPNITAEDFNTYH